MSEKTKYGRGKYPRHPKYMKTMSMRMPADFPLSPDEARKILLNLGEMLDAYLAHDSDAYFRYHPDLEELVDKL